MPLRGPQVGAKTLGGSRKAANAVRELENPHPPLPLEVFGEGRRGGVREKGLVFSFPDG